MRRGPIFALAIALAACTAPSSGGSIRPTASASQKPLAISATSPSAAASIATSPSAFVQGSLLVTPASAAVGSTVFLRGRGCNNPGSSVAFISLEGSAGLTTGTEGAFDLGSVFVAADGTFTYRFVVPSRFAPGSLQGEGGGLLVPGTYQFVSHPPYCQTSFTMTR